MQPSKSVTNYCGTPEDIFSLSPELPQELPIDAINCAIARAQAVLCFVMSQYDGTSEKQFSDHIVCNALWAVEGDLTMIHKMVDFAWRRA